MARRTYLDKGNVEIYDLQTAADAFLPQQARSTLQVASCHLGPPKLRQNFLGAHTTLAVSHQFMKELDDTYLECCDGESE